MHLATRSTGLLCVAALAACTDDSALPPTAPTMGPPTAVSLAMAPDPTAHTDSSGGATTVRDATDAAFSFMSPNIKAGSAEFNLHEEGDEEFEDAFTVNDPLSEHNGSARCSTTCRAKDATPATAGDDLPGLTRSPSRSWSASAIRVGM